jgi:HAMP domain-containing protein
MRNLLISQKFMLVAVAVSVPIAVLSYLFVADKNAEIERTRAELDGTAYLRPLRKLATDVAVHRDLMAATLAGASSFTEDLEKRRAMIDDDFKEIAAQQQLTGLAAPEVLASVRGDWDAIKAALPQLTVETSLQQHTRQLSRILQFMSLVANDSNLVLDGHVQSHYLIDAIVFRIPKLSAEISIARAHGAPFIVSGGMGEQNSLRRGELAGTAVKLNDALYETHHYLRFAANKANPQIEGALAPAITENGRVVNGFVATLVEQIVNGTGQPMPIDEFFAAAAAAIEANDRLWNAAVKELDRLLEERTVSLQQTIEIEILVVGLAMLFTIGFLFIVARAITNPIMHLSEVADRISLGDMDASIDVETRDEIGELGERFRRMQVSLKAAMEALDQKDQA